MELRRAVLCQPKERLGLNRVRASPICHPRAVFSPDFQLACFVWGEQLPVLVLVRAVLPLASDSLPVRVSRQALACLAMAAMALWFLVFPAFLAVHLLAVGLRSASAHFGVSEPAAGLRSVRSVVLPVRVRRVATLAVLTARKVP